MLDGHSPPIQLSVINLFSNHYSSYVMQYKDIIDELKTFIQILDSTDNVPEFVVESNVNGYFFATKEYFDNKIFKILFDASYAKRGEMLKIRMELKKRLAKLNWLYAEFSKFPEVCTKDTF